LLRKKVFVVKNYEHLIIIYDLFYILTSMYIKV